VPDVKHVLGRAFLFVIFLGAVNNGCGGGASTSSGGTTSGSLTGAGGGGSTTTSTGTSTTASTSTGTGGTGGAGGADGGLMVSSPIKHVVVIVKENHTFDNYFGTFPGAEGTTTCKLKSGTIPCPKAPDLPRDMCHTHDCALADWDLGKMDGFEQDPAANQNGDYLAWSQYDGTTIPNYWAYAEHFALADHFFANVLGPSFPGHMFFLAAQAGWAYGNPGTSVLHPYWGCDQSSGTTCPILANGTCTVESVFPCFSIPSIPDVLPKGIGWKFYGSNFYLLPEVWSMFNGINAIRNGPGWANVVTTDQFTTDIQNHTLPAVTWLVNQDLSDEHPGIGGVCAGENWTVGYVNQIMASNYWSDTVIFFSMDDFGGWYDHVPPPRQYGCDAQHPYGLGFRLPLIIMSPYVKQGVYKNVAEQASIPRFIERIFGAPALSTIDPAAQDGQANDLLDAFDFTQTPIPPLMLQTRSCL
jgi:phospholipase C